MALHCPDCGETLRGNACGSCGYGKKSAGKDVDPHWYRCSNEARGQRCSKPGSVSHGTHGTGPWLCWQHFTGNAPTGDFVPPPSGFRSIAQIIPDPELVAEREAIASA